MTPPQEPMAELIAKLDKIDINSLMFRLEIIQNWPDISAELKRNAREIEVLREGLNHLADAPALADVDDCREHAKDVIAAADRIRKGE